MTDPPTAFEEPPFARPIGVLEGTDDLVGGAPFGVLEPFEGVLARTRGPGPGTGTAGPPPLSYLDLPGLFRGLLPEASARPDESGAGAGRNLSTPGGERDRTPFGGSAHGLGGADRGPPQVVHSPPAPDAGAPAETAEPSVPAGDEVSGTGPATEDGSPPGEEPAGDEPAGEVFAGEEPTGGEPTGKDPAAEGLRVREWLRGEGEPAERPPWRSSEVDSSTTDASSESPRIGVGRPGGDTGLAAESSPRLTVAEDPTAGRGSPPSVTGVAEDETASPFGGGHDAGVSSARDRGTGTGPSGRDSAGDGRSAGGTGGDIAPGGWSDSERIREDVAEGAREGVAEGAGPEFGNAAIGGRQPALTVRQAGDRDGGRGTNGEGGRGSRGSKRAGRSGWSASRRGTEAAPGGDGPASGGNAGDGVIPGDAPDPDQGEQEPAHPPPSWEGLEIDRLADRLYRRIERRRRIERERGGQP